MNKQDKDLENFVKNTKITPELARLHAHICGDGCIYTTKTKRNKKDLLQHPRKNIIRNNFHIEYWNNDINLLYQFLADIKNVFNRGGALILKRKHIDVQGKRPYTLLKVLGAANSYEWFISKKIISSSNEVIIEWIKAFFDDEAHVPLKKKNISVSSVNKKGLCQVKRLLSKFGISSKVLGPYFYHTYKQFYIYHLYIDSKNIKNYHELIGFNLLKKKERLKNLIK